MGFFDGIANAISDFFSDEYTSPPIRVEVPERLVFRNWMQQVGAHFGAAMDWDRNGLAVEMKVRPRGEGNRYIVAILRDGTIYLTAPSNVHFEPGTLPRDVAGFLSQQNEELGFADWSSIETDSRAYFALKASGRMDGLSLPVLKKAVEKMLVESLTLDKVLRKHGYRVCDV